MRSLQGRLFAAILGAVLIAVGASLSLGIVLTRDAVEGTIRSSVEQQAEALVGQPLAPPAAQVGPGGASAPLPASRSRRRPGGGGAGPGPRPVQTVTLTQAARLLPAAALAQLRRRGAANGTTNVDGHALIFAARRTDGEYVLVTRPNLVSGADFSSYLAALLIASGAAALLAAALAMLLARRLTGPLRSLQSAAVDLAAGRHPEPLARGGPRELDQMAASFNAMAEQLALARDAERGVLLSVSHDLRTPLTSIRGYAEGIEDGTVDPRGAARVVSREAARLERLVGDLLALARLRQGVLEVRREPVDLRAVVREAQERLGPGAGAAGVRLEVRGGETRVQADHGRTLQVVSNLLENAIRVSPAGGTVTISLAPGEISIADEGPGLPPEEIPRAFERFHLRSRTGHGSPEGAGLGLAIVDQLTRAMGGSVGVENLSGRGARFTVRLPGPAHPGEAD